MFLDSWYWKKNRVLQSGNRRFGACLICGLIPTPFIQPALFHWGSVCSCLTAKFLQQLNPYRGQCNAGCHHHSNCCPDYDATCGLPSRGLGRCAVLGCIDYRENNDCQCNQARSQRPMGFNSFCLVFCFTFATWIVYPLEKTFQFSARTAWSITHAVWTMLLFAMQISLCELVPAAELRWVEAVWKRRVDEYTTNPAALKRRGWKTNFCVELATFFSVATVSFGEGMYIIQTVVSNFKLRLIGG